jgi:hypothetical protein
MRTRRAGAAVWLALLLSTGPVGVAIAASPSPSPGVSAEPSGQPPERPPFEVWLDGELPAAPQPGSTLDVGATVWDRLGNEIPRMGRTIFLRAVPPGGGKPVEAVAISDWPGHFRGSVEVPAGGLDRVELGVTGTICENEVCRPDDWVFPIAGAGPPPGASLTRIAGARFVLGGDSLRAGEPADVSVVVEPRADWASWPQPAQVVVRAREPRGPNVATATLPVVDAAAGSYAGRITVPRAGDFVLEAATDEDGGDATRFGTSMTPVTAVAGGGVQEGGGGSEEAPPATADDEGLPPILIALLIGAAVLGAGVILAGFRSASR